MFHMELKTAVISLLIPQKLQEERSFFLAHVMLPAAAIFDHDYEDNHNWLECKSGFVCLFVFETVPIKIATSLPAITPYTYS